MHCKKYGEKVLKLLIMCLMTVLLTAFSCESVYAEETVEKDNNENIQESETSVAGDILPEDIYISAYLKALLDNSYKNDSSLLVLMGIATPEEAAEAYEKGLDNEVKGMDFAGLSAYEEEKYRQMFADILAGAKYTVGAAEKQDDGSYIVTVSYEQMNVFNQAFKAYVTGVDVWADTWSAGTKFPSDDELMEWIVVTLRYCIEESLKSVSYDEPRITTVRISLVDDEWVPDSADVMNLEEVFFDMDDAISGLD